MGKTFAEPAYSTKGVYRMPRLTLAAFAAFLALAGQAKADPVVVPLISTAVGSAPQRGSVMMGTGFR